MPGLVRSPAARNRLARLVPGWLQTLLITLGAIVVSWLVLIVLARRLPPGVARDLAQFLPDCVTTARRLRRDPRVPRRAKIAVAVAALWVLSPIDLIPEFLPVIGPLDDIVVVALLLRYTARSVPRAVLFEAWPGNPDLLQRLIGTQRETNGREGPGVRTGSKETG